VMLIVKNERQNDVTQNDENVLNDVCSRGGATQLGVVQSDEHAREHAVGSPSL